MEKIAAATLKKQEIVVERDLKRKEMYLASRQEDAEKNREHKLRLVEMYVKMFSRETQPSVSPNPINLQIRKTFYTQTCNLIHTSIQC